MLVRLAGELDRLDSIPNLDPAVRARTVARVCTVALAAHKQAAPGGGDDEEPWDYSDLTDRELATLRRLVGKVHRTRAAQ